MKKYEKTVIIYGLEKYNDAIENIIKDLNLNEDVFDLKLLLTEAITNAFFHGNNSDKTKPIYISYLYNGKESIFRIKDSGMKKNEFHLKKKLEEIEDVDLLNEGGRGLFLIYNLCDQLEYENNTLIIKKTIRNHN